VGAEDEGTPGAGELAQIQSRAVEEVQESVVAGGLPSQSANDAGDPQQFLAGSPTRQTERHPQEGSGPGAGGRQIAHQIPPVIPEHERPPGRVVRCIGIRA
jgi:hypothetical protein